MEEADLIQRAKAVSIQHTNHRLYPVSMTNDHMRYPWQKTDLKHFPGMRGPVSRMEKKESSRLVHMFLPIRQRLLDFNQMSKTRCKKVGIEAL